MTETAKERLKAAAIIRNGEVIERGFRTHFELRQALGDSNLQASNLNDEEGFVTSTGRFVNRNDAVVVGIASGQLDPMWIKVRRRLLSSDINW